jgi:hypothetical protein
MSTLTKKRKTVIAILFALAIIMGFGAITSTWVRRQALDSGSWPDTSSKLLADKQIQEALGAYLVNELFTEVDVAAELRRVLPPEGQALSAPAAAGLRQVATRLAPEMLARPRVQDAWRQANATAHSQLLKVLNGGGENISTTNGEVVLNLRGLVDQLAATLGLSSAVATARAKLPEQSGELTIMKSDQLGAAQDYAKGLRHLSIALTILFFGLLALAVYLAKGSRRVVLRATGLTLIGLGIACLLARRVGGNGVVDGLVKTESIKPAVHNAWNISTSLLYTISVTLIVYGLLVVTCSWLAGPTRLGVASRRALAPSLRDHVGRVYGIAAGVYLLVLLWAPTPAFKKPLPILLIAGLVVLGIEVLRRQTAREFPDAAPGEATERVRGWFSTHFSRHPAAAETTTNGGRHIGELERLATLRDTGVLTEAEFASQKAALIGG